METNGKRAFELLKKIGFVRTGGSKEELKAANILLDEVKSIGHKGQLDAFKIKESNIEKVQLEVLAPYKATYEATAYGLSGSTPDAGLVSEFAYVQHADDVDLVQAKDKIVLLNTSLTYKVYEDIVKAGAKGFITFSGSVLDEVDKSDIAVRSLRKNHMKSGIIPGVMIRVKDAMDMVKGKATKVRLTLIQEENEVDSQNVLVEIKGTEFPDEKIAIVAHYDSTPNTPGVYDNGAGSVIIMEMLRYYTKYPPKRTVQFMWFGAEERGLLGSKAYIKKNKKKLKKLKLVINVDMAGAILGEEKAMVTADISLKNMIDYLANEVGHSILTTQQVYSSDSTPFAYKGIPAVSFARFGAAGAIFTHSRNDVLDYISADSLKNTAEFLKVFCNRIINACVFPVPSEMPKNMVELVDEYMNRGKKKR
ncbi:MAG: Zn-dependent exopeptidase M28 [Clostridiales bacterium]|nr:Zn-dependent exopeptidase M28 [Clostridiales bacterium]